mgnify:CR=1 FL=1
MVYMDRNLVRVKWIDSVSIDAWTAPEDIERKSLTNCETVGFLIHKDKKRIIVSSTIGLNSKDEIEEVSCTMVIPCSCIIEIKDL